MKKLLICLLTLLTFSAYSYNFKDGNYICKVTFNGIYGHFSFLGSGASEEKAADNAVKNCYNAGNISCNDEVSRTCGPKGSKDDPSLWEIDNSWASGYSKPLPFEKVSKYIIQIRKSVYVNKGDTMRAFGKCFLELNEVAQNREAFLKKGKIIGFTSKNIHVMEERAEIHFYDSKIVCYNKLFKTGKTNILAIALGSYGKLFTKQ